MKKIIKWSALLVVCIVLVSLFYYVREKKSKPVVSGDELLRLALLEIQEHKNYPKAIELTKEALIASPGYTDVRVTLARAFMLNGNIDSAKIQLEKAISNEPENAQGLLYLINISMQTKDTIAGLRYLDAYTSYYPEERESWLKEYLLLLEHREYKKAETVYNTYTRKFKSDTINNAGFDFWRAKGDLDRKQNDLAAAYKSYRSALRFQPAQSEVLQQLVNLSIFFTDYQVALKYNDELLRQHPLNRQYLINESTIYQNLHDKENAAKFATNAYVLQPSDEVAKKNLIDLYLSFAKDETVVNKIYYANLALRISPAQKEALLLLITAHLAAGQYTLALDAINRALSYYPTDPAFFDQKISAFYGTENY
ncbi:MAG: tetratricopeptide repeat protein, partial [Sediminibacterium sp.]